MKTDQPTTPKPFRHWFQYSLRTLFMFTFKKPMATTQEQSLGAMNYRRKYRFVCLFGFPVIFFEMFAFILLKSGCNVTFSITISICSSVLISYWRYWTCWGWHLGTQTWNGIKWVIRYLTRKAKDRRTYQYSLGSLLIFVFLVACVCSWYSYRLRKIEQDKSFLQEKWRVINKDGTPYVLQNGKNIIMDWGDAIEKGRCIVNPLHDPKWIDFYIPGQNKPSKGIYRIEGERVRILQSDPNCIRPASFQDKSIRLESVLKSGSTVSGPNESLWEHLPSKEP